MGEEGRLGRDHWDRVLMECPRAHGYLTIGTGIVGIGRGARMVMIDEGFGRRLVGLTVLRVPRSWLTPPAKRDKEMGLLDSCKILEIVEIDRYFVVFLDELWIPKKDKSNKLCINQHLGGRIVLPESLHRQYSCQSYTEN